MSEVQWEDPPEDARLRDQRFAEALKNRQGEWAYLGVYAPGKVTDIRHGGSAFGPQGAFEATGRRVKDSKPVRYQIWVRYVGP